MKLSFITLILRRKALCIALFVTAFFAGTVICCLHLCIKHMEKQIENVLDNTTVNCAVTNLSGTQSDHLSLPNWTVELFIESDANNVSPPDVPFTDYLKDIQLKVSMDGELAVTKQFVDVSGITSFSADRSFRTEDISIMWFEGFDESVFKGSKKVCLLPADYYSENDVGSTNITVTFYGKYNRAISVSKELTVAGVYSGEQKTVYCPWDVVSDVYVEVNGYISADCIYATIRDNRRISEFKKLCVSSYFVEPDPKGTPQVWGASPLYDYYPYAFAVYDEVLNDTIGMLQRNRTIFSACQKIVVGVTLIMGMVVGNLSMRQQRKELALKYLLGCSRIRIFCEASIAHLSLNFIGVATAIGIAVLLMRLVPPWNTVLSAYGANYIGAVIAARKIFGKSDILLLTKEE